LGLKTIGSNTTGLKTSEPDTSNRKQAASKYVTNAEDGPLSMARCFAVPRSMGFQANIDPAGGRCVDGCAVVSPCFASVDLMAGAAARPVADQRGGRASR
jgi:hypothetical protein